MLLLTPAISVMSEVEGLRVATSAFQDYIVPITAVIPVLLFLLQNRGTTGASKVFRPIMRGWFLTISVLGAAKLMNHPETLAALLPVCGVRFFLRNGYAGFVVAGGAFLTGTGLRVEL